VSHPEPSPPETWDAFFTEFYLRAFREDERSAEAQALAAAQLSACPPGGDLLDVPCGFGRHSLPLARAGYRVTGVDRAQPLLDEAARRAGGERWPKFVRADYRDLPFADASFDACWTLGGFNYFRDHAAALREMARVTRPGGIMVVADENPKLHRFGIGNLLGFPAFDALWLRALGLDRDFAAMVQQHKFDPAATIRREWPGATRHAIWCGLGYCFASENGNPPGRDMA
jgi:ubiquinone/menaquinone biosynthesis C-methylase UbiE